MLTEPILRSLYNLSCVYSALTLLQADKYEQVNPANNIDLQRIIPTRNASTLAVNNSIYFLNSLTTWFQLS